MAAFGGLDDDDEDDNADLLGSDEEEGEEGSGSQVSLPSIPWHTCPEQCGMRSPYCSLHFSTLETISMHAAEEQQC